MAPAFVLLLSGPLNMPGSWLWRCAFGFGAVLALLVVCLRWFALKETREWEAASARPSRQHTVSDQLNALWSMRSSIMGTVGVWLIYDVVTYGTGLYSTTIFPSAAGLSSASVVLYINLLTLPGFAGAILLASRVPM